jgi:hypothetical protein
MLSSMANAPRLRDKKLAAFWPMCGADYQPGKGMLVVGRAPNGWTPQFMLREAGRADEIERIVSKASNPSSGMEWVTNLAGSAKAAGRDNPYNTNTSAFWRTAHQVAKACGVVHVPDSWSSSLAWSNLYKLAPAESDNPTAAQCEAQLPACCELLALEIEAFNPAIVMVVAGADWWEPFNAALGQPTQIHDGEYVEATGNGARGWVVTCRPEFKPQAAFVTEVCQALTN